MPGTGNPSAPPSTSTATAASQQITRACPCTTPPATAKPPLTTHQTKIRSKLLCSASPRKPERGDRTAPDLHAGIAVADPGAATAEGIRNARRHHQADEHHRDQRQPDREPVGVEPVRDPHRVGPDQPDHRQQQRCLQCATDAVVRAKPVGELSHREDVDQVEEQLDVRRSLHPFGAPTKVMRVAPGARFGAHKPASLPDQSGTGRAIQSPVTMPT